jgi:hypothetical protein
MLHYSKILKSPDNGERRRMNNERGKAVFGVGYE